MHLHAVSGGRRVTDLGSMQSSPAAEMGGGGPAAANGPGSPGDDPDALTGHALLDWAKKGRWSRIVDSRGFLVVELAAIVLWAVYFTRPYLDMDPAILPAASICRPFKLTRSGRDSRIADCVAYGTETSAAVSRRLPTPWPALSTRW